RRSATRRGRSRGSGRWRAGRATQPIMQIRRVDTTVSSRNGRAPAEIARSGACSGEYRSPDSGPESLGRTEPTALVVTVDRLLRLRHRGKPTEFVLGEPGIEEDLIHPRVLRVRRIE